MAELYAAAGARIYIGGILATKNANFVVGDFASQTWVEVDGFQSMGAIGDTSEVITTQLINRGRDLKQKGTKNAGTYEAKFVIVASDAGQAVLKTAQGSNENYAFKITYPSGETEYFIALVMTRARADGEANDVLARTVTLEINSNIVEA
jgi:hypothetical protein